MPQFHASMDPTTITGVDAHGHRVEAQLDSVLVVAPDRDNPSRTRLLLKDGVVLVDGHYEEWMETLAGGWSSTRTEPFDAAAAGVMADGVRWNA